MKHPALLFAVAALPLMAWAADPAKTEGTLIDFRVESQKSVANDLGRATAYVEMTGTDPADVARKVKNALANGLATAKGQAGITVKSGNTHTWPSYAKGNRTSIEAWRMRSEILLESRDAAALSAAVGRLQGSMAIGNLSFSPAPETRRKAEDEATLDAIAAFSAKAAQIATTLKKPYRIRQLSIGGNGHFPQPYPVARSAMLMAAEAAPMPTEAGESYVTVTVSGQIELAE